MIKFTRLDAFMFDVSRDPVRSGCFNGRLRLVTDYEDGEDPRFKYVDVSITPGMDFDDYLARLNAHIADLGFPPMEADDVDDVRNQMARRHTPEVKQAFSKFQADELEKANRVLLANAGLNPKGEQGAVSPGKRTDEKSSDVPGVEHGGPAEPAI